jgi:hypothetical protein
MSQKKEMVLLVGDNPFHGISHLSQQRSRARSENINDPQYCSKLVLTSLDNGANGFMFSVSETTLSILKAIRRNRGNRNMELYAIVPYAYEYVRMATQSGGISGLAKQIAKKLVLSGNIKALATGFKGLISMDPESLLKSYMLYEISRIRSSAGKSANLRSVFLHEIITEMAISLNMHWLFDCFIDFASTIGITPGFETRNFVFLMNKLTEWNIDPRKVLIATPFNKAGFQMSPSREGCERALAKAPESNVIAMSVLAAGYLKLTEAIDYLGTLSNLKGIVVGVSRENHAHETFQQIRKTYE